MDNKPYDQRHPPNSHPKHERSTPFTRQEFPYAQNYIPGGSYPGNEFPVPYQPPAQSGGGILDFLQGGGSGSGGSKFNMADLKAMVDRMGGIDGILNSIQKVNKIMQTMQQMGPMLKLMFGSLSPSAKASVTHQSFASSKPKKKRVTKRSTSARRRRKPRRRRYAGQHR